MAYEFTDATIISVCADCCYYNAYGRLNDMTMEKDRHAAEKHRAAIAANGWPYGTVFELGCGRECEEHGIAAYGSEAEYELARDEGDVDTWFSWSPCDECGSRLGGDREHATAYTYNIVKAQEGE